MPYPRLLLALAACTLFLTSFSQERDLELTNAVHFELLGFGRFYSLNYERTFTDQTFGKDLSAWQARGGFAVNGGEARLILGANRLIPTKKAMFGWDNMFTEYGAAAVILRDFTFDRFRPYLGVSAGIRKQPKTSDKWLAKAHIDLLLFRERPVDNPGILGYIFPTIGIAVGRGF